MLSVTIWVILIILVTCGVVRYRTTIRPKQKQAAILKARVDHHLFEARKALINGDLDLAESEFQAAQDLDGINRSIMDGFTTITIAKQQAVNAQLAEQSNNVG